MYNVRGFIGDFMIITYYVHHCLLPFDLAILHESLRFSFILPSLHVWFVYPIYLLSIVVPVKSEFVKY